MLWFIVNESDGLLIDETKKSGVEKEDFMIWLNDSQEE